jgi:radical SAM-linked protein
MKVRVRFSKHGKVRFTSHRDVARIWERALRKATVPVAYSEGFSPRPKLSFGLALPTGHESLGEYLDVDIKDPAPDGFDVDAFPARLDPCLPVGFHVQGAVEIDPGTPSLQQAVVSCTWRIEVGGLGVAELAERVDRLLAADSLVTTRERKGRQVTDDLRPAILALELQEPNTVVAELATQPRGLRPSELVALLGADVEEERACRIHQWTMTDGALAEPIPIPGAPAPRTRLATPATSAPHAEARAS